MREAEELKKKYLGPQSLSHFKNENINEIRTTIVRKQQLKPRLRNKVKYEFQELLDNEPQGRPVEVAVVVEAAADNQDQDSNKNNDASKNLSKIILEKERIRSLITPNPDNKEKELLDINSKKQVVANNKGLSPYQGGILKVVSVNHKLQKKDPVFQNQCNDDGKSEQRR